MSDLAALRRSTGVIDLNERRQRAGIAIRPSTPFSVARIVTDEPGRTVKPFGGALPRVTRKVWPTPYAADASSSVC